MTSVPASRRVIINADDFGMSEAVNLAIVEAFRAGAISSTTIMANMPGFGHACMLALKHELVGKIGVHLNLTAGQPLTDGIKQCPELTDGNGMFLARRRFITLTGREKQAIRAEFAAQVKACLERDIRPTHLDSHHHVHTEWPIGSIVIDIARQFGIPAVRLSRNCGPGIDWVRRVYKSIYNARLRAHGLAKTRYFGSAVDVLPMLTAAESHVEAMVHISPGQDISLEQESASAIAHSTAVELSSYLALQ